MRTIQQFIVKEVISSQSLYMRVSGLGSAVVREETLHLEDCCVDFNTFFNVFDYGKWLKYTKISRFVLSFNYVGTGKLLVSSNFKDHSSVTCIELQSEQSKCFNLDLEDIGQQTVSVAFIAQKSLYISRLEIKTDEVEINKEICLAINICTLNRNNFLFKTLKKISNIRDSIKKELIVYVVDNSNSLVLGEEFSFVRLLKLKGMGSTGGFTRGLLEASKDGKSTHVLFMDDDIKLEPHIITRLINLLKYLKKPFDKYYIGGILLALHDPCLQVEAGGLWKNGSVNSICGNVRLDRPDNLLLNTNDELVNYQGWWFSCVPLSNNIKYPIPIYFHREDVEYGLRANGNIYLNGIGVWHNEFDNKPNPKSIYYDFRNMLVVESIHNKYFNFFIILKKFILRIISLCVRMRVNDIKLLKLALEDFSKGSNYLVNIDNATHDHNLSRLGISLSKLPDKLCFEINNEKAPKRKFAMIVTILWFLFKLGKNQKYFIVFSPKLSELRGAENVSYISLYADALYSSHRSGVHLIREILNGLRFAFKLRRGLQRSILDWKDNYSYLNSQEFWELKFKETK